MCILFSLFSGSCFSKGIQREQYLYVDMVQYSFCLTRSANHVNIDVICHCSQLCSYNGKQSLLELHAALFKY